MDYFFKGFNTIIAIFLNKYSIFFHGTSFPEPVAKVHSKNLPFRKSFASHQKIPYLINECILFEKPILWSQ